MKKAMIILMLTVAVLAGTCLAQETSSNQWSKQKAQDWYDQQPWLVGCNFSPSTAINQLEMWQADTFDPETIDRELGWAASIGMNTARVYLHDLLWTQDSEGFLERIDLFLDICKKHNIRPMLVLFDSVWNPQPKLGKQPEPRPHLHNSGWVQSPHIDVLKDPKKVDMLEPYVKGVLERFKDDTRVLMWDVYNEAGHSGMGAKSLPLLNAAFEWVREVKPDQPVTAGIGLFLPQEERQEIMKRSDVVTLADYESADQMIGLLSIASTRGRPVICTGWLEREKGSTFKDILPLFSKFGAGWYNWGLVQGRTQLYMPWGSKEGSPMPEVWGQDLLKADGEPFDEEEIRLIKGFSFDKL